MLNVDGSNWDWMGMGSVRYEAHHGANNIPSCRVKDMPLYIQKADVQILQIILDFLQILANTLLLLLLISVPRAYS